MFCITEKNYIMPNTLVHICVQTPASRMILRDADFKWIALGCIIPDIPWILQRIILYISPGIDLIDLRSYAVIQASLLFCLLFSLALSLFTTAPGRIFFLLALNSFLHLIVDALEIKWSNGVHFFAPFSWQAVHFPIVWPEHTLILVLSLLGIGVLIYCGTRDWKKPVTLTISGKKWTTAGLLLCVYFLAPFLLFHGPGKADSHYISTLQRTEDRPGKYIEFDRIRFRGSDRTIQALSGERLQLHGNIPAENAQLSIRGRFLDEKNIRVTAFHVHGSSRDLASIAGLAGVMLVWILAMAGKNVTFENTVSQTENK
ncbi:MAG: hypothetical protein SCH71_11470 [Desulfobulbaceae bacterium]|nr:hypothetical protein [Desulfobulbaceae bacterium]